MSEVQTPVSTPSPLAAPAHSSTIQILKVDAPEKKSYEGRDFTVYSAQAALLLDDGSLHEVGRLPISEEMFPQVKVGIFRATFSLRRASWGKNKGDIVSALVGLVPVPQRVSPKAA